ncbi:MAG TPA: acyl-CoA dehydrogenase family protein [Polyangiaceae bacterium]|nr:acyl-CoA dehydrogenase family protein [Polyangiaceae bacterium]
MSLHLPLDASDRDREIATLAEGLARGFAAEAAAHDKVGRFPLEHYARLHEAGYLRLALPPALGGGGATLFQMVLAQEHLSQAGAALGVGVAMLLNVIGRALEPAAWPAPLIETVFRRIARDGGLANLVVSEPALGSISRGGVPQTVATRAQGGWRLNGHKIFVTAAPALRYLVTVVHLPPDDAAPQGYVAEAVVEAPAAGLRIEPTWGDSLSQRSGGSDDVWFEDVFVPDERMVGRRVLGSGARPPPLSGWWLTLVAVYVGVGQAALNAAADYARQRVPSVLGAPLAELPHIQQWIGEMHALLSGARALLYDAARAFTRYPEQRAANDARLDTAKYAVTNAVCRVTDLGLRVAGGFGLTRQLTLEQHFRDARGGLFQPPQDDLALRQIGRFALAPP